MQLKNFFITIVLLVLVSPAWGSATSIQGHVRSGMVSGSFSGAESGKFSVPTSLELEGEYFTSSRGSILARATVSLDQGSGQFKYIYMGLGQRFYLWSRGRPIESYGEGVFASQRPKFRYYVEYGLGLAQIQVRLLTESLSAQSTAIELGLGGGTIYQVSQNFGISISGMWSKGFSISSVSVDSTIVRGMIGVAGYF